MNASSIGKDLTKMLTDTAVQYGRELGVDARALGEYTAERLGHLTFAVKEPGYEEAVVAERDAIALFACGKAVDKGDAFDARALGLIEGVLRTAISAAV